MNRDQAKELLPIIQAFADGKTVELYRTSREWESIDNPDWVSGCEYRIKPEPRVIYVDLRDDNFYGVSFRKENFSTSNKTIVKFIEVID